jgi:hypothetical protein
VVRGGGVERKGLAGRSKSRWEDNIGIDLQDIGWEDMNWIDLAKDR